MPQVQSVQFDLEDRNVKVLNSFSKQKKRHHLINRILSYFLVCLFLSASVGIAAATEPEPYYVKLTIEPHNVGVFYENKTQQFTAYGYTTSGEKIDITEKVDWYIDPKGYPHSPDQPVAAGAVATIDETGLATVHSTWGRVVVYAAYPKGSGSNNRSVAPLIQPLLLGRIVD